MTAGRALWAGMLALWAVWRASTGIRENDTFWHLGLGRAVLREGSRVVHEPWALPDFARLCVVPEWLWDVTLYGLYRAGGTMALGTFLLALAAVVPALVGFMLHSARPDASFGAYALVSMLCTLAVSARLSERPDVMAMSFVALSVALAEHRARSSAISSAQGGMAVMLTVLWAQVHGTFVLAPCVFGAYLVGRLLSGERHEHATRDALWLALVCLACLSSAHGAHGFDYVLAHTRGDAVRHIIDMGPPAWSQLNPSVFLYLPLTLSLLGLGVLGALVAGRVNPGRLLIALGGAYIASTALRGVVIAALLAAPFALDGALALAVWWDPTKLPRLRALFCSALPLVLLCYFTAEINERYGPLFRFGLQRGNFPVAAAHWLKSAPPGTRALTTYAAGAYLGFALDGRVRTFVDSRTPMYFDDLDYALSRDLLATPDGVVRAVRRYAFDVAIVRRDLPDCESVARSGKFDPVLVEPRHTLFVRRQGRMPGAPLTTLHACGMDFVSERSCSDAAAAEQDMRAVAAQDPTLAGFLRIERAVRCQLSLLDVVAFAPTEKEALGYEEQRRLVLAHALIRGRQFRAAVDMLQEMAEAGYEPAVRLAASALASLKDDAGIVTLLSSVAELHGDAMLPDLRAALAQSCLAKGDIPCARFHAIRAAARGAQQARQTLTALVGRDTGRRKREAAAWLDILNQQGGRAEGMSERGKAR